MSPESTQASKGIDCRADIYSLGANVYALLTGRPPFEAATVEELFCKIRDEKLVRPKQFLPSLPDVFDDAVARMLAKRPEDRYQTPGDLVSDLRRIAEDQGLEV